MKPLEKSLWQWLAGARGVSVHLERVENSLSRSTPDVNASVGRGGFWIELKTATEPVRKETPIAVKFQRGQVGWLRRRWDVDRGSWVLVQVGRLRYLVPGYYAPELEVGVTAARLVKLSLTTQEADPHEVLRVASENLGQ